MYFNQPIFSKKLTKQDMISKACEAASKETINYQFKQEFTLRDKYFPYIESFLPKTEHILFRYISRYEDKNATALNSPYPLSVIPFSENGEDSEIIFKCTHIDKTELKADIKKVPLPKMKNATEKASFQPLQVVLYLILRYYKLMFYKTKKKEFEQKYELICRYYGYSLYWKRFSKSFPGGVYDENAMVYTINNMSNRNIIKKEKHVWGFLQYIIMSRYDYYVEQGRVLNSCDEDILYVLDQCLSDLGSKVNNIADQYIQNYKNKDNRIFKGSDTIDDDGTQRLDTSITASVEMLAQKYTNDFFAGDISYNRVKQAALFAKDVSAKELQNTMSYVLNNAEPDDIHEFYASLFYIYLNIDDPKANIDSVTSIKFFAMMKDVIKKGNSTNKNIVKIRELMINWLEHGSNTYRVTSREATKTSYRKAVYFYFVLSVTNNS